MPLIRQRCFFVVTGQRRYQ